jgi:DnaJ-class molecular chaperone
MDQAPDFAQIMKLAQQVASQIEPPAGLTAGGAMNPEEMSNVLGQITKTVGQIVTPEMLASQFGGPAIVKTNDKKKKKAISSKISFESTGPEDITDDVNKTTLNPEREVISDRKKSEKKKRYVEIVSTDEDTDEDPSVPRTKDMTFTLSVTLDELFTGAKKKLGLRRQKLEPDGSFEEEKKKLSIKIEPGMIEEQVIRFNHMADEKQGYETGDVVVSLDVEDHPEFIRHGNDLILEREISFAEAYSPVVYVKHLSGKNYKISGAPIDIFNNLDDDLLKKIPGLGMPVSGEPGEFGDLFIKFICVNKTKITKEIIETLKEIFPPLVKPFVVDETETIIETEFEMVTESDLEYLESDSDSDSDDSEDYDSDDSDSDSEEQSSEKIECADCDEETSNAVGKKEIKDLD